MRSYLEVFLAEWDDGSQPPTAFPDLDSCQKFIDNNGWTGQAFPHMYTLWIHNKETMLGMMNAAYNQVRALGGNGALIFNLIEYSRPSRN